MKMNSLVSLIYYLVKSVQQLDWGGEPVMLVRLDTNIYKCKNVSIWVISYLRDTKDYYVFPPFPISATASALLFKNRQTKLFFSTIFKKERAKPYAFPIGILEELAIRHLIC